MADRYKPAVEYLTQLNLDGIEHTGTKHYLGHLIAVYRDLKNWGCNEDVCLAGLVHSLYGTQRFQGYTLPVDERIKVQELIGERAERLAYYNCFMLRPSFDALLEQPNSPYAIAHRETGETMILSRDDYDDLCRVHLCDWLEQVPRSQDWDYRRAEYQKMANRLGGVAKAAHEKVFAKEGA